MYTNPKDKLKPINIIFMITIIIISFYLCSVTRNSVSKWNATQWLFLYDGEYIKRGVVGSILNYLSAKPIQYEDINFYSYIIQVILCTLLSLTAIIYVFRSNFRYDSLFITSFFFLSPFTLRYIFEDSGRLDFINYLIIIILIYMIVLWDDKKAYFVSILLSIFTILIHEASLLLCIPLFVSFLLTRLFCNRKHRMSLAMVTRGNKGLLFLLLILSATIVLTFFYGSPGLSFEKYHEFLDAKASFAVRKDSTRVLYTSIEQNILFTYIRKRNIKFSFFQTIFAGLIWLYFPMYFSITYLNKFYSNKIVLYAATILPVLCPLLLIPIGVDTWRWFGWSVVNAYIYFFITYSFNTPQESGKHIHLIEDLFFTDSKIKNYINYTVFIMLSISLLIFQPDELGHNNYTTFFQSLMYT